MLQHKPLIIFWAILSSTLIIRLWYVYSQPALQKQHLDLTVQVIDLPKISAKAQIIRVKPLIKINNIDYFFLVTAKNQIYNFQDQLKIKGTLQPNGYVLYPKIRYLSNANSYSITKELYKIRSSFEDQINKSLPLSNAQLVSGMLLGKSSPFSLQYDQAFRRTGTLHILVVSGYNLVLLTSFITLTLKKISFKSRYMISIITILLFTLLTGAQPPVLRASVMLIFSLTGQLFGRPVLAFYALLFSSYLILILSPQLISSVSFQLSFLSTFGLIITVPVIKFLINPYISVLKHFQYLIDELITTFSAQLFVLPLIIYYFNSISLSSFLANILIAWTVPYIMILGLISILASYISSSLILILNFSLYPFTAYLLQIVLWVSSWHTLYLENIKINIWNLVTIYAVMLFIIVLIRDKINYSINQKT